MTDDLDYTLSCLRRSSKEGFAWTLFPAGAAALVAEVERLRAEASFLRACVPPVHPSDYGNEAWTEAIRAYVAEERAAVVAWLRSRMGMYDGELRSDEAVCEALQYLSAEIERGDHRREEEK